MVAEISFHLQVGRHVRWLVQRLFVWFRDWETFGKERVDSGPSHEETQRKYSSCWLIPPTYSVYERQWFEQYSMLKKALLRGIRQVSAAIPLVTLHVMIDVLSFFSVAWFLSNICIHKIVVCRWSSVDIILLWAIAFSWLLNSARYSSPSRIPGRSDNYWVDAGCWTHDDSMTSCNSDRDWLFQMSFVLRWRTLNAVCDSCFDFEQRWPLTFRRCWHRPRTLLLISHDLTFLL